MGHTTLITASLAFLAGINASPLSKRAALDDCLKSASVPTLASGSADYTQSIKPFNNRVTFKPAAYAVPTTVKHVQDAVACGATNKVSVTAKSGGHSYGSHGLGGEDGHLIIDMRNFKSVTLDTSGDSATIGTGGRLGDVATALYNQGKKAISHGTCPGVGVGGLSLHGGYGLISRSKGLTLDNIISAEVVLANSSVVTASATQNPELFYALRGAGSAFGIVTNFKFKTFTPPESNLVFQYSVNPSSSSQLATIIAALQDYSRNTQPAEMNMRLFLSSFSTLSGVYYGTRDQFDKAIQPLLSKTQNSGLGSLQISTNTWINTLSSFAYGPLQQQTPYDTHETFFSKSLMPEELSSKAITALADYWQANARSNGRNWYLMFDLHGGKSSAITQIPANSTAYAHRNAVFKMQFYDRIMNGNYNSAWFPFLNGWIKAIKDASPGVDFGMYINYADTSLTKDEAHNSYWVGKYKELAAMKKNWDPKGTFLGPQLVGS